MTIFIQRYRNTFWYILILTPVVLLLFLYNTIIEIFLGIFVSELLQSQHRMLAEIFRKYSTNIKYQKQLFLL